MKNISKKLSLIVSGRQGHNYKEFSKLLDKDYLIDLFDVLGINIEKHVAQISRDKIDSKIKTKIFGLELCLSDISKKFKGYKAISNPLEGYVQYEPISEYPSSTRDLSFSIQNYSKINEVIKKLESINATNLKESFMFDFYENTKTNITKVGYRFIFQSYDKTLTDHQIDNEIKVIVDSILTIDSVSLPGIK